MSDWNLPKRACLPSILSFLNAARIIITVTGTTAAITCQKIEDEVISGILFIYLINLWEK